MSDKERPQEEEDRLNERRVKEFNKKLIKETMPKVEKLKNVKDDTLNISYEADKLYTEKELSEIKGEFRFFSNTIDIKTSGFHLYGKRELPSGSTFPFPDVILPEGLLEEVVNSLDRLTNLIKKLPETNEDQAKFKKDAIAKIDKKIEDVVSLNIQETDKGMSR